MALEIKEATAGGQLEIAMVDETNTTLEGKRNYLLANRPKGINWLLPIGLRTPERPWDDYVAEVIARRYIAAQAAPDGMKEKEGK